MALATDFMLSLSAPASLPHAAAQSPRRGSLAAASLCSPSASSAGPSASARSRGKGRARAVAALDASQDSFLGRPLRAGSPASCSPASSRAAAAPRSPRAALSGLAEFSQVRGAADNTVDLCIFPMSSVPLPTSSSTLNVFEPDMVALLQVIQHVAAAVRDGGPARFGALPAEWVRRQMALAEDGAAVQPGSFLAAAHASGHLQFPETEVAGTCCVVDAILQELQGDAYFVQHRAVRRFRPVQILRRQPFLVLRAQWLDDEEGSSPAAAGAAAGAEAKESAAELELAVWDELQAVEALTARLAGRPHSAHDHSMLPAAVAKYAPHVAEVPQAAVAAAWSIPKSQMMAEVDTWRRMKSVPSAASSRTSVAAVPAAVPAAQSDPYWSACEKITKSARQEAFSFAAASVIELGPEQRQEVLSMTSTSDRLRWVLKAIEPYLQSLKTQCAMRRALGDL